MRSNVAYGPGYAGLLGVGSPLGLLGASLLDLAREPPLLVLDDDFAYLPEVPLSDHVRGLPDHRVAGVLVGDSEDDAALLDDADEVLGLLRVVDHRLVAHHVEAGLGEGARHRIVHVVRRDHAHEVDALLFWESELSFEHLLPGAVISLLEGPARGPKPWPSRGR